MKKFLLFALAAFLPSFVYAQTSVTPNVGLQIPAYGSTNWQVPLGYTINRLDQLLSGFAPLPALNLSGPITLSGPPILPLQAATKGYVDAQVGGGNSTSLQGIPICSTTPTSGQQYVFNGTSVCPATISASNATSIQSIGVSNTAPSNGQALIYNSSSNNYVPGAAGSTFAGGTVANPITAPSFATPSGSQPFVGIGPDGGISRCGATTMCMGNGTFGDATARVNVGSLYVNGVQITGSGGGGGTFNGGTITTALTVALASGNAQGIVVAPTGSGMDADFQLAANGGRNLEFFNDGSGGGKAGYYGFYDTTSNIEGLVQYTNPSNSYAFLPSGGFFGFGSASQYIDGTAPDTGFSRYSAGILCAGNAPQDCSATLGLKQINLNSVPIQQSATAPSGSCSYISWVLSNDGHLTFCNGSTYVSKL